MKFWESLTPTVLLRMMLITSLFVLIFISAVTYKQTIALNKSSELVVKSYMTQLKLEQLLSILKDAETGQRGFIITNDSTFLEPYFAAQENINRSFNHLKALIKGNLQQEQNLDSLLFLKNHRMMLLEKSLREFDIHGGESDIFRESLISGKLSMNVIREHIDKMIDLEKLYLEERKNNYDRDIFFTPVVVLLLMVFALAVIVVAFWKINTDLAYIKKSNQFLKLANETIRYAEQIGEFGLLQWNMSSKNLIYSDNLFRLVGCEPQSFEPTFEKFLEFVHPKDKYLFANFENDLRSGEMISSVYYRVIRKDGQLRHFKFFGKIIELRKGVRTFIGTNQDVSDQVAINMSLEEKNEDLLRSNKELASFNYVASHDLQEPLRKVLTCISWIEEREVSTLSEKGAEYFTRIKNSVSRMRVLIDDLLQYSRTNKADKALESADLNALLESTQQDLMQVIEEKKAIVRAGKLPVAHVIPFQIKQLFSNIIGNSLKYSRPGVNPVIDISCTTVDAKSETILAAGKADSYFKIAVRDNGIGFEQKYAEDIFTLFHRLHSSSEFPGTGIGLTTCKKIAENHSGFITAHGEPGVGSTFTIYIPVEIKTRPN